MTLDLQFGFLAAAQACNAAQQHHLGTAAAGSIRKKHLACVQVKPMFTQTHSTEGFALAWSRQAVGALAVGDCRGKLHTWDAQEGGTWAVSGAYQGHTDSVEDIEWSPTEATVFATACIDKVCAQPTARQHECCLPVQQARVLFS